VRAVTTGPDGAFQGLARGAVFVDHTTASAALARELAADAEARGAGFVDAPVSGGQAGAENGQLTVMCGGAPDAYARAEPVIAAYAKSCRLMGAAGAGQLTKMVNQICIAGLLQGLSEALAFAQKAGLDGEAVLEVISKGAAGSWQMENRGKTMLADKFDFGFAVNWMRKDLRICLAEAEANGAHLPATALIDQFYKDVQLMGGGRWDTSSLIRRLG
jgi:3-hydroxyisobutyrate dehydrogenase